MNFEAEREALLVGCATASRAVSVRALRPALASLHLEAGPGGLTVSATDLETTISAKVAATINQPGVAAVPARQLLELLRRCGKGPVQVCSGEGTGTNVAWLRSKFELRGFDPAEFPELGWPSKWVPAPGLRDAAARCVFAAATGENARALLTGVHLSKEGALATDGFQVAHSATALQLDGVTVPASALGTLGQIAPDGDVEVALEGNRICFLAGDTRLGSRVLEGKYFAVLELIPKSVAMTVTLERRALLGALGRVLTVVEHEPPYALILTPQGSSVVISARSEAGEAHEEVAATLALSKQGAKPFPFGVNGRQLTEGLRALRGATLTCKAAGETLLTSWDDGSDFRYHQMPLQLSEGALAKSA